MDVAPIAFNAALGCPLCRAADEAEARHIRWFLRENCSHGATLHTLTGQRYCRRHADAIAATPQRQVGTTFDYLVRLEIARLWDWPRHVRSAPSRLAGAAGGATATTCPACEAGRLEVAVVVARLAGTFSRGFYRLEYERSDGFCIPHLWQVLAECDPQTADWLAAVAQGRLIALLSDLQLYFHRTEHRYRHESHGEEQEVWRRALARLWMAPQPHSVAQGKAR